MIFYRANRANRHFCLQRYGTVGRGACRLRQFWRFNLILTHCGFLGRASAKQSEISENSEHSDGLADARTMVCRSWLTAYPPWRRWGVVWSGTACHRLPGWRKCPPFVIIIAFCHRLRRRRWGCDTSRPRNQMQIPPIQWMINQPNRRRWDAIHIYLYRYKYRKVEPARCGCNRNW